MNPGRRVGIVADILYKKYDRNTVNETLVAILRPHRVEQ